MPLVLGGSSEELRVSPRSLPEVAPHALGGSIVSIPRPRARRTTASLSTAAIAPSTLSVGRHVARPLRGVSQTLVRAVELDAVIREQRAAGDLGRKSGGSLSLHLLSLERSNSVTGEKDPLFETSTRDDLSVPQDTSGNSLEVVDTLADSREITGEPLSREG